MEKQTKSIGVYKSMVCGGLALVGGMAYLYMNRLKTKKGSCTRFTKEAIVKVLKDFQKEFYAVNRDIRITISLYLNRMQQMHRGQRIPQQYIQDLRQMVEKDPRIVSMLEKAEDAVYERNEIFDRKAFEDQVKSFTQTDPDIKKLSQSIKTSYEKAFTGQYEILDIKYPSTIDEEMVFNIKRDITKMELKEMIHFIQRLQQINKSTSLQELETRQALDKHVQEKIQQFIYPESFDFTTEHYPQTIHSQAMIQYADKNRKFEEKLIELQEFKGKIINALQEETDFAVLEQELEQIDNIRLIDQPLIQEIPIEVVEEVQTIQEQTIQIEVKEDHQEDQQQDHQEKHLEDHQQDQWEDQQEQELSEEEFQDSEIEKNN